MAGLVAATALLGLAPADAPGWLVPAVLAGAVAGSVLPDLDLYAGHRRTLHYPSGYVLGAVPTALAAMAWPTPILVVAAVILGTAALHCRMDRYGGGLELRPWEGTSERAAYDHLRGRWRRPKRWIPYDGAPSDLALSSTLALPVLVALDGPVWLLVSATLGVGLAYAVLRRRLAALAPRLVSYAPAPVHGYVPERYAES
jgi:hypothetical protein